MDDPSSLFRFELDFAGSLHCIPMAVRFKLDHCGVKLSLRQWNRFDRDERERLLRLQFDTAAQRAAYREFVLALVAARTHETAQELPVPSRPEWDDAGTVPEQLRAFSEQRDLPSVSLAQWQALTPFRRYVLLKLSRPKHDNMNFVPALQEFGLIDS